MNDNTKNMQGFTLIELLAVIVVLAIVILAAATAVIPRMNEARTQVFALEANHAIDAAKTYFMNNSLTGSAGSVTLPVKEGEPKCVTITDLIKNGDFDADIDIYKGYVLVQKVKENYLYKVTMSNGKLMVNGAGVGKEDTNKDYNINITSSDVQNDNGNVSAACPNPVAW